MYDDSFDAPNSNRKDITSIVEENTSIDEASDIEFEEKEVLKQKLLAEFENDPLYPMVANEYEILSEDILALDPTNVFSTKDTVEILDKYEYLYDAIKGESYINENRIRWWLNEKEDDNLIDYFKLRKPGRSWIWDTHAIIKAKMVAILRFAKNHQQKMIKHYTTGILPNTPKISDDNVLSLIEQGNLDQVKDFDVLKQITLASIQHFSKERELILKKFQGVLEQYQGVYGTVESLKEENEKLQSQLLTLKDESVTKTELTEHDLKREQEVKERDRWLTARFEAISILKKEALAEWDQMNSGFFKKLRSKEAEKENFIGQYIDQRKEEKIKEILSSHTKSSEDKKE